MWFKYAACTFIDLNSTNLDCGKSVWIIVTCLLVLKLWNNFIWITVSLSKTFCSKVQGRLMFVDIWVCHICFGVFSCSWFMSFIWILCFLVLSCDSLIPSCDSVMCFPSLKCHVLIGYLVLCVTSLLVLCFIVFRCFLLSH